MPRTKKGKVITITSMKGGVGKTIFTLHLATVLKKQKQNVLIIDLDLYNGDIAFSLNLEVKSTIYNLCDDVANNRYKSELINEYIVKYDDYIDVLASPKDPRQASKIDRKYLEVILRNFANRYDIILIDTNHILGANNMVAFECSDIILDVFTNDAFDLKSTKNFISICKNMNVDNLMLVLNNSVDERKKYFDEYEMENLIKSKIDFTIPKSFYIKNLDKHIVDGKTLEVCEKLLKNNSKDAINFSHLAIKLLKDNRKVDKNEKE